MEDLARTITLEEGKPITESIGEATRAAEFIALSGEEAKRLSGEVGPVVSVTSVVDIDKAIAIANDSKYGLSAAIFTQDIDCAMKFAKGVESENIHIGRGTQWRADLMPYGGLKESGMGKD